MRQTGTCFRTHLAAVCVASLAAIAPALAQSEGPSRLPVPGLVNFGQVDHAYYRGGEPNGEGVKALAALGIKTVIDLQTEADPRESSLVSRAGMTYVHIPMTTHTPPTASQQAQFLSLVTDPERQPVYVHCREGRHRTGVMTAVYRMNLGGWTADRAFQEMKAYDFGWDFLHPEFKAFVKNYVVSAPAAAVEK